MSTEYVRMVIGETISEDQLREYTRETCILMAHAKITEPELTRFSILNEDGGNMTILITEFTTREACLRFHSSRIYRLFVQNTMPLLVGNHVVKLFTQEAQ